MSDGRAAQFAEVWGWLTGTGCYIAVAQEIIPGRVIRDRCLPPVRRITDGDGQFCPMIDPPRLTEARSLPRQQPHQQTLAPHPVHGRCDLPQTRSNPRLISFSAVLRAALLNAGSYISRNRGRCITEMKKASASRMMLLLPPRRRGYVFIGVCLFVRLFVSRITQKNYSANFRKTRRKGGTFATEETYFGRNPHYVTLGLR